MSIDAARSAGVNVEVASAEHRGVKRFMKLLGIGKHNDDEEEADASASPPAEPASPPAAAIPLRTRAKAAVVAAVERAEDKIAAEKTKLAQAVAKIHLVRRAEAAPAPAAAAPVPAAAPAPAPAAAPAAALAAAPAPAAVAAPPAEAVPASAPTKETSETPTRVAADTPHDIIIARGFWQGLPDGVSAAQPAPAATKPLASGANARRAGVAIADADPIGSLTPWSEEDIDRAPSGLALAYAEPTGRDVPVPAAPIGAQKPRTVVTAALAARGGGDEMTIAVKRVGDRPASAILTVTNRISSALADGERLNDPWLRAIVLSPSVRRFLTAATLGAHDLRSLAAQIVKPASSVMMTFAAEPNPGLDHDHFSGSAIVFVSTVTYPTRTASLH
jgi:hypothetical protein